MENRNGLFVDARLTKVSGHAERPAALDLIEPYADRPNAITLGGDKGFDAADFVMELRDINVTPHIVQNTTRRSAIDRRATRHSGYEISQRIRKRVEEQIDPFDRHVQSLRVSNFGEELPDRFSGPLIVPFEDHNR
jgi:hypothetical protein